MSVSFSLTSDEQAVLGRLAIESIDTALAGDRPVVPDQTRMTPTLRKALACFVTLTKPDHSLRGCIGLMQSDQPLFVNVWRMARQAAFQDPRFAPVTKSEWPSLHIDINVLGAMTPCPDPSTIVIGQHGIMLRYMGRTGVFLPSVPVEQRWDLSAYLTHICYKAGVSAGSWQHPGALLWTFETFEFQVPRS